MSNFIRQIDIESKKDERTFSLSQRHRKYMIKYKKEKKSYIGDVKRKDLMFLFIERIKNRYFDTERTHTNRFTIYKCNIHTIDGK